jgi:hypothetical protein
MPLPRHRLDLLVLPASPAGELGPLRDWAAALAGAAALPAGAVAWAWEEPGGPRFWSSGLGGFRVFCPVVPDGAPITAAFVPALEAWRHGGRDALGPCPRCGGLHPLDALRFAPEAGFAPAAVRLVDVARAWLEPGELPEGLSAAVRVIPQRPG